MSYTGEDSAVRRIRHDSPPLRVPGLANSETAQATPTSQTTRLHIRPLSLAEANALVEQWHRHHKRCTGHRFSVGVYDPAGTCHGAAIVGRPVGGATEGVSQLHIAEVSRLVTDGTFNACSALYGASARIARAMGFVFVQTYILASEPGTSLKASGWEFVRLSHPQGWSNGNRPRGEVPDEGRRKQLWRKQLNRW